MCEERWRIGYGLATTKLVGFEKVSQEVGFEVPVTLRNILIGYLDDFMLEQYMKISLR